MKNSGKKWKMTETNKIGLAGEFYALHRLFLEDYEATLTLGNTKGVDILVYNPENDKQFKVEVKTTGTITNTKLFGKNMDWWMGKKHEDLDDKNLIFCFVFLPKDKSQKPKTFFVPPKEVAKYVKWQHQYWVDSDHKKPIKAETTIRAFRIPVDKESEYEDNFSLFE